MNRSDVQAWLDRYVEAWAANDPKLIGDLFTDDVVYRYRPWDSERSTMRGRDAVVKSWLEEPDEPGTWKASYEPYAVDGDRAVAIGTSDYPGRDGGPIYYNCFLLRFVPDGRCAEFTEYWFERPKEAQASAS